MELSIRDYHYYNFFHLLYKYLKGVKVINTKIHSITLSLAGVCQAAYLVQQLAKIGYCDNHSFQICLKSVLEINPTSVITIYGNDKKNLKLGLQTLLSVLQFSTFAYSDLQMIKYIFNMMVIEKKLKKNATAIHVLQKNILKISSDFFIKNEDIEILITQLAILYLDVISSLGSRIEIKGVKMILQNEKVQEKIRCVLLAGIRSIVLWKQLGGNMFKLLFFRCSIIKEINEILHGL